MKVTVNSRVESGRLVVNRKTLANSLKDFEGQEVTLTIAKRRNTRSNQQNAYYWSAVVPIVRDALRDAGTRLTIEDTHLALRAKFLSVPISDADGLVLADHIKSTTSLTKGEFGDYIEDIRSWCYDYLNTEIPEANTQTQFFS